MYGLSNIVIDKIQSVLSKHKNIDSAILYGSRAIGTNHETSDIDITLKGCITLSELLKIEVDIDDLMLPYKVDLSVFNSIQNRELLEHIERVGKIFFENN